MKLLVKIPVKLPNNHNWRYLKFWIGICLQTVRNGGHFERSGKRGPTPSTTMTSDSGFNVATPNVWIPLNPLNPLQEMC